MKIVDIRFKGSKDIDVYVPGGTDFTVSVGYNYVVHLLCENGRLSKDSIEPGFGFDENAASLPFIFKSGWLPKIGKLTRRTPISVEGNLTKTVRAEDVSIEKGEGDEGIYRVTLKMTASVRVPVKVSVSVKLYIITLWTKEVFSHVYAGTAGIEDTQEVECTCSKDK
jgi:hypothetical protein